MTENVIALLKSSFNDLFNEQPEFYYFSPGRINLIGEHLDYNGGHVFPAAISFGTYAAVSITDHPIFNFYSLNFKEEPIHSIPNEDLIFDKKHSWTNYAKGVIKYIEEQTNTTLPKGLNICVYGNIQNGAGLSSSASLELLIGYIINDIFSLNLSQLDLIKIGQRVENEFIGLNSGIMDQFAIGMGKESHAILLNCNDLSYEYAPLHLKNYSLVIINSNKRRELSDSKYNERRAECELALQKLQTKLNIQHLCDLDVNTYEQNKNLITDINAQKRAKHVVYENTRTLEALNALQNNDLTVFGKLMNDSHISLKEDYDVTGKELDTIFESAIELDYVLGSRMTGAGFGGCAIALVQSDKIKDFKNHVHAQYMKVIGYEPEFYEVNISDGPKKLKEYR
ncbi:galactokinase [Macrococcus capreoli]|uniref:galactokinase n=1 Tax=Macrococcus capreoli TaxID=2982690 RepID=UPI0021D591D8|nr:galactokinase [Macrococcus sp. TMW 2.2395]MCU7556125.1 galactokinase [Macrococcus sp. TMW 2.2395]